MSSSLRDRNDFIIWKIHNIIIPYCTKFCQVFCTILEQPTPEILLINLILFPITPGEIKQEITTDIKGDWSYTIPKSAKSGSYNLTILILDKQGNAASVKSYPLKITFNKNYQQFALVSQVSAFTSTPTGRIRASAVTVPTGQTYGVTQITVDQMQNFGSNALICVVSNAPNASPVTFAAPGSSAPWSGYTAASYTDPNNGPWIASGVRYTFNLYNWNSGSANHSDCTGTPVAT